MRIFGDPRQALHAPLRELHNGEWARYAETPERFASLSAANRPEPARDFGMDPILAVHDAGYVGFLQVAHAEWLAAGRQGDAIGYTFPVRARRSLALERIDARIGAYAFDASTPIAAGTWSSAYWSAQSALTALDAVAGGSGAAAALCRPPGHHAGRDYMGGYCYLNNAAIIARRAAALGMGPVAILDVDYHHGNGTQDIFYTDPDVLFVSLHADPATDYPFYWGHADERGSGAGLDATLNLPLPRGTDWHAYRPALDSALETIARWGAKTLIVSYGADTYRADPISEFLLDRDDYRSLGAMIGALALPTVTVMEGGYAVADLGDNLRAFLAGFASRHKR